MTPIKVTRTPDKVELSQQQVEFLLRAAIERATGRKVAHSPVVSTPVTGNYRMTFELEPEDKTYKSGSFDPHAAFLMFGKEH